LGEKNLSFLNPLFWTHTYLGFFTIGTLHGALFSLKKPNVTKLNKNQLFGFYVENDGKVTPEATPNDPQRHPNGPQRRQMEPNDAPEALQWSPKGDKWSPNGRPKASKAAQWLPKTTEDRSQ